MSRTTTIVTAAFGRNDIRTIRFMGNPEVNKRVSVKAQKLPSIQLVKARGEWSAHIGTLACRETVGGTSTNPRKIFKAAVSEFWAS